MAPAATFDYELVPGRVAVHIVAHDLSTSRGAQRCWSYVTSGLRAFGQNELVLTLAAPPGARPDVAPPAPLALLRTIAGLAEQGRIVHAGGLTEVGPQGLFDQPQLRGLAYQTAAPMDGVPLPPGCLAAIALVGPEIDTVKRYGALRVLARIGRAYTFYPTAPWCDPARPPTATHESGTILQGVACASFAGVSATLAGDTVTLRLPLTIAPQLASGLPPPDAALAFLTTLDAGADACLVWSPGQKSPEAIAPPGSVGARLAGCFALFAAQQASDGGNPFEDGFAFLLTDATWGRVRNALARGAPLEVPATTPGARELALEWYAPR